MHPNIGTWRCGLFAPRMSLASFVELNSRQIVKVDFGFWKLLELLISGTGSLENLFLNFANNGFHSSLIDYVFVVMLEAVAR